MAVHLRDITHRVQLEAKLRDREQLLSAIFGQASAGFAQVDLEGRFELVNDAYCLITGYNRMTRWEIDGTKPEPLLRLEWIEQGGPPVERPTRKGFGTRMIERALASELSANVELDFRREGLVCRLTAPLPRKAA